MGDRKNFNRRTFCELASGKDEIVAVVPLKAEGAPVPGAGFSPDAVPGNSAEMEDTRTNQLIRESTRTSSIAPEPVRRICSKEAVGKT
jgi:hypothetical protein